MEHHTRVDPVGVALCIAHPWRNRVLDRVLDRALDHSWQRGEERCIPAVVDHIRAILELGLADHTLAPRASQDGADTEFEVAYRVDEGRNLCMSTEFSTNTEPE